MSDLDRFELFTYVAQTGNITQSAKQLQLTKAAVSKQIKKLEAELRVDLFLRSGQRLHLTEQGEALLQQCLRLKEELENTRTLCEDFHAAPRGELHIVIYDFVAQKIIYPRLGLFMKKYPELNIFIDTNERIPDFEQDQADIAVGFALGASDEVVQRYMGSTRYVMCASEKYLKKYGEPKTLDALRHHHYIGHKSRDEIRSVHLQPGHQLKLKPTLVLNSIAGMIECAKQGLGVVQLPFYLLKETLQAGELVEILTAYQATDAPIYYYYSKFRYTQPKVRCFIDYFLSKQVVL